MEPNTGNLNTLLLLSLAWSGYFILHSWLASNRLKAFVQRPWPGLYARYRLVYNLLAVILLIPPLALLWGSATPSVWRWQGGWQWLSYMLTGLALAGFWLTTRHYNMKQFLGIDSTATAGFHLSPVHRYVRHPWYGFGLLLLWSQNMDQARLTVVIIASLYLWLGSRLEDRKLVMEFGPLYDSYRRRVPGILPWPGKLISRAEADSLMGGQPLN